MSRVWGKILKLVGGLPFKSGSGVATAQCLSGRNMHRQVRCVRINSTDAWSLRGMCRRPCRHTRPPAIETILWILPCLSCGLRRSKRSGPRLQEPTPPTFSRPEACFQYGVLAFRDVVWAPLCLALSLACRVCLFSVHATAATVTGGAVHESIETPSKYLALADAPAKAAGLPTPITLPLEAW